MEKYAFLTGIEVSKGMFPTEKVVVLRDYNGKGYEGVFDNSLVQNNELEVKVIQEEGDLALITPASLGFMDERHLTVKKSKLRWIKDD